MKNPFRKLNAAGAAHVIVPLLVIVGVGIAGSYFLFTSHASSITVNCYANGRSVAGQREYNCGWYTTTPVYSTNSNLRQVGTLHRGTNWITCQQQGAQLNLGRSYNVWYGWTQSDQGAWGWVNAVYASSGTNNGAFGGGVPFCNGSHGATPAFRSNGR